MIATIDVYKVSPTGEIVGCHAVAYYRPGDAWKRSVNAQIERNRQGGFASQVLLPIHITGEPAKRTPEQLDYDRSQQPIWQGTDTCAQGTAAEDYMPRVEQPDDFDIMGIIDEDVIGPLPAAHDIPFTRTRTSDDTADESYFPKTFRIASSSTPGSYYDVKMLDHSSGVCHCKGFSYRHRCSHIEKARALVVAEIGRHRD